jgi:TPR repeat protein
LILDADEYIVRASRDTIKYDSVLGTGIFLAAYNLVVFYETTGDIQKAKKYYKLSANHNYKPAIKRFENLDLIR